MKRVLFLDQQEKSFETFCQLVPKNDFNVQKAKNIESALHQFSAWKPDLVLVDAESGDEAVLDLVNRLRLATQDDFTPIGLIVSQVSVEQVERGFEVGVDDWILRPMKEVDVLIRLKSLIKLKQSQDALKRFQHRIEEVVSTDELTGLMSMRSAYKKAEEELARARRLKKPASAFLLNIDNFSEVNQRFGFGVGSYVLQEVAIWLKRCLRTVDVVARIGADEFFVYLTETGLEGAEFVAERVRDAIQSEVFRTQSQLFSLTVSIGVAGFLSDQAWPKMSDLLNLSIQALKSAKSNGQNRIEVYCFT